MTRRFRDVIALAAVAVWFSSPAGAQQPQPQPGQTHDPDAHHRDMLTRGAQAMGFDQERTVHHFLLYEDGGAIEVAVKEASDPANLHAIRQHLPEIAGLFINHDRITRTVTNLPDGIRTVTESDDARIAQLIKEHVASMGQRVDSGDDPGLPIESQALRSIFQNYEKLETKVETTEKGIVVVQTSTDPQTVAALQQHASEVTDFVKDGMAAMHTATMKNGGGMMQRMHGGMMGSMPNGKAVPDPR